MIASCLLLSENHCAVIIVTLRPHVHFLSCPLYNQSTKSAEYYCIRISLGKAWDVSRWARCQDLTKRGCLNYKIAISQSVTWLAFRTKQFLHSGRSHNVNFLQQHRLRFEDQYWSPDRFEALLARIKEKYGEQDSTHQQISDQASSLSWSPSSSQSSLASDDASFQVFTLVHPCHKPWFHTF